jgi:hypothetical protein
MWWGTAIEAPDPGALANFYSELLGWPFGHEEPGTVILAEPQGFDFQVGDLDSAVGEALRPSRPPFLPLPRRGPVARATHRLLIGRFSWPSFSDAGTEVHIG